MRRQLSKSSQEEIETPGFDGQGRGPHKNCPYESVDALFASAEAESREALPLEESGWQIVNLAELGSEPRRSS
jgi:hypothetical protein